MKPTSTLVDSQRAKEPKEKYQILLKKTGQTYALFV